MHFRTLKKEDEQELLILFKQLTKKAILFNIESVINDSNCNCIVAEDNGKIAGFGSLVIYQTPIKSYVGNIEDIVVDEGFRGQGLGKKIVQKLIQIAKDKNIKIVSLTSSPSRVTARKLYASLGFSLLDTGVFRLSV